MSKKSAKIAATYFITIICSLLIIGGVGYFVISPYLNNKNEKESGIKPVGTEQSIAQTLAEEYAPSSAEARTVLVIYEAEKSQTSTSFVLARFAPAENKLVLVPLQTDIYAKVDGKANTLYEFYRLGGTVDAKAAVENATGIKIDKYLKFSRESFTIFSDLMGNVRYTIPYNLIYEGDSENIVIKAGEQLLDSGSLRKVLTYPNYDGGEEYRAKVVGSLAVSLANSGANGILHDSLETVFNDIINSDIETDITRYDFDDSKRAIEFVLDETSAPAQLVIPSGVYDESGCYVLDESFVNALPKWFYME